MSSIDVVVVCSESRDRLRACVEPLAALADVRVFVVDNASSDAGLETVADLRVTSIPLRSDRGFAHACNVGWRAGEAPYVLFLTPEAHIELDALQRLVAVVAHDPAAGLAAPWILGAAVSDLVSGASALLRRTELEARGGVDDAFRLHAPDVERSRRARHVRSVLAAAGAGTATA